jgi:hypothetical protein
MLRKSYLIAIAAVFAMIILAGAIYEWIVPGLSSARTEQSQVETAIATWLLHQSVPEREKERVNSVGSDPADITRWPRHIQAEVRGLSCLRRERQNDDRSG